MRVLAIKEATKQYDMVKMLETYQVLLFFTNQSLDNLLLQLGQAMLLGAGGRWCSIFGNAGQKGSGNSSADHPLNRARF